MKARIPYRSFLFCSLLLLLASCCGGDNEIVYDAFYSASLFPERFDEYVRGNLVDSSDEFLEGVAMVKRELARRFQEINEVIEKMPPEHQDACRDVDEVKLAIMLDSMSAVVRGETSYSGTITGGAAMMAKQAVGTEQWLALQQIVAPTFKPVLLCD